ncbi:hypothetical protein ACQR1V_02640 [Bradyrhizobium oligotrophicum]|uniref:hypothetical protein n=1 Tax=Bradyrhizobium oligotrophicum TaxID=44255 RepID=UPI003EB9BC6C
MSKSAFSVNGGAMPKFNRAAIMRRAWAIFRQTYKFPQIKFRDIGRSCFAWALRKAWAEAQEAVRLAAIPAADKSERIEVLHALIERAGFIDSGPLWRRTVTAYRDEIRRLQAA